MVANQQRGRSQILDVVNGHLAAYRVLPVLLQLPGIHGVGRHEQDTLRDPDFTDIVQ
jgi:hypothetical protein